MATAYYTDPGRSFGVPRGQGAPGEIVTQYTIVALSTTIVGTINNTVALLKVPKNAVILGYRLRVTDMDSSTGLTIDVGDAGDPNRLIDALSGQAAGEISSLLVTGFLYKYTADTVINLTMSAAATTAVAGTAYFSITYAVDENFSTTALVPTSTA